MKQRRQIPLNWKAHEVLRETFELCKRIYSSNERPYLYNSEMKLEKINCDTDNLRIRRENGLLKQIESVRIFNLQRVF